MELECESECVEESCEPEPEEPEPEKVWPGIDEMVGNTVEEEGEEGEEGELRLPVKIPWPSDSGSIGYSLSDNY